MSNSIFDMIDEEGKKTEGAVLLRKKVAEFINLVDLSGQIDAYAKKLCDNICNEMFNLLKQGKVNGSYPLGKEILCTFDEKKALRIREFFKIEAGEDFEKVRIAFAENGCSFSGKNENGQKLLCIGFPFARTYTDGCKREHVYLTKLGKDLRQTLEALLRQNWISSGMQTASWNELLTLGPGACIPGGRYDGIKVVFEATAELRNYARDKGVLKI